MMNFVYYFFFNDTATTEIYTLSLHDALPIFRRPLEPPHEVAIPEGLDLSLIPEDVLEVYELATGPVELADGQAPPTRGLEGSNNWVISPTRTITRRPIQIGRAHV